MEIFNGYNLLTDGTIMNLRTHKPVSQFVNKQGYLTARLKVGDTWKSLTLHRLIAEYFIPKQEGKNVVNHIDGNKLNNDIKNLEWVTHQENMEHVRACGLIKSEKHGPTKLTLDEVYDIRYLFFRGFGMTKLAKSFRVHVNTIRRIVYLETWKNVELPDKYLDFISPTGWPFSLKGEI